MLGDRRPDAERSAIEIPIPRFRLLPSEVSRHRLPHHLTPGVLVLVLVERAHRCVHELLGGVAIEEEAGHAIFDGVRQAADPPRDRDRTVCLLYTSDAADERSSVDL